MLIMIFVRSYVSFTWPGGYGGGGTLHPISNWKAKAPSGDGTKS